MRLRYLIYPLAAAMLAGCVDTPATRADDCVLLYRKLERLNSLSTTSSGSQWRETDRERDEAEARYRRLGCGTF